MGTGGRHTGDLLLFPARLRLADVPAERLPAVMDALYADGLVDRASADRASAGRASADRAALARALQTAAGPSATVADLAPALRYLFVCAHARRDDRCGACLGGLLPALRAAAAAPGARPPGLSVWATSHIGGHAHAGNAMYVDVPPRVRGAARLTCAAFSCSSVADASDFGAGDWYGRLRPEDVPDLLAALADGALLLPHWRGRYGSPRRGLYPQGRAPHCGSPIRCHAVPIAG